MAWPVMKEASSEARERHHARDILRHATALNRLLSQDRGSVLKVTEHLHFRLSSDGARDDGVDGDPFRTQFRASDRVKAFTPPLEVA